MKTTNSIEMDSNFFYIPSYGSISLIGFTEEIGFQRWREIENLEVYLNIRWV
jgi:hypothetical protein